MAKEVNEEYAEKLRNLFTRNQEARKFSNIEDPDVASLYRQTNAEDLKLQYRKLMIKFHPDRAGEGATEKCQLLQTTYQNLNKKFNG